MCLRLFSNKVAGSAKVSHQGHHVEEVAELRKYLNKKILKYSNTLQCGGLLSAGTATLSQRCHNVVVDVDATL